MKIFWIPLPSTNKAMIEKSETVQLVFDKAFRPKLPVIRVKKKTLARTQSR
jgi:hypothetical protein